MDKPDFDGACHYALTRMAQELAPDLLYHSLAHTRDEVVPAVERLAALEGVNGEARLLLRTAAYFHDIGFVRQREEHEAASAAIAAEVLPHFGYDAQQVEQIKGMIMATRLPQTPRTPLEGMLADADLDVLGRDDFLPRNDALRAELAALGSRMTDKEWLCGQLRFLESHHYFTEAAQALRGQKKQENLETLRRLLDRCKANGHGECVGRAD